MSTVEIILDPQQINRKAWEHFSSDGSFAAENKNRITV